MEIAWKLNILQRIKTRNVDLWGRNVSERVDFVDRINSRFDDRIGTLDVILDIRPETTERVTQEVVELESDKLRGTRTVDNIRLTAWTAPIIIESPPLTTSSRKQRKVDR